MGVQQWLALFFSLPVVPSLRDLFYCQDFDKSPLWSWNLGIDVNSTRIIVESPSLHSYCRFSYAPLSNTVSIASRVISKYVSDNLSLSCLKTFIFRMKLFLVCHSSLLIVKLYFSFQFQLLLYLNHMWIFNSYKILLSYLYEFLVSLIIVFFYYPQHFGVWKTWVQILCLCFTSYASSCKLL